MYPRDALTALSKDNFGHDHDLIAMWLHGRPAETTRGYLGDVVRFLTVVRKPLEDVTARDIQGFQDSLAHLSPATIARAINTIKSLYSYHVKLGTIRFNPAGVIRPPKIRRITGERILSEGDVQRMFALETDRTSEILLRSLYASAMRCHEAAELRNRDVQAHGDAGVLSIWGKGGKTRAVRVSVSVFALLLAHPRRTLGPDAKVFGLCDRQIRRIVRAAGKRAGVGLPVSPHWLRHSHATHALDRGCPIHLVTATLGHASVMTTGIYLHARPNESSALYLAV